MLYQGIIKNELTILWVNWLEGNHLIDTLCEITRYLVFRAVIFCELCDGRCDDGDVLFQGSGVRVWGSDVFPLKGVPPRHEFERRLACGDGSSRPPATCM